jgi:O-acetyl-ADP-ribose deacetylase (regulator of RNase III)
MIQFIHGNLFDTRADILINPVNCVGVMGNGIALEFKRRYPAMFDDYREACLRGNVRPGELHVWRTRLDWIVNLPTKRNWIDPSRYEDVELGLDALWLYLRQFPYPSSVALPALGCGNGGLDWARVKPMVVDALGSLPNTIYVFEPEEKR